MSHGTLKIHSQNILPIIKKWLYSDKDIFLRELVSNSCDAISKMRILRDRNEASATDEEFRIDVQIDKKNGMLKVIDTGIGMTADEVERYIAQLAFSGAEEFLEKYKSEKESDQVIGHFGLGFYSAFMVSEKVSIQTRSYKENAEPAYWSCEGSSEYLLEKGERAERGTEITLQISKESEEYLEESKIKEILEKYCSFLPYSIYLNDKRINDVAPLWIKSPSECTEKEYKEFYRKLHPFEPEPIFWIHLNIDYPFNLKGILYFPKITKRFDASKSTICLYSNRVFVSDNCKDIVPDFLMMLRGAIDSPDIPLNVSRSYLQMDRTVRQLASHISKKVSDRLVTLCQTEKDRFISLWPDIEMLIKLGIIQDDKFYDRTKSVLLWKNQNGEWTTLEEYFERNKEINKEKVFYSQNLKENSQILQMYKEKGIEVICADSVIDTSLMSFLESKFPSAKFQRVDGGLDSCLLDKKREKTLLDAEGKTEAVRIADFFRIALEKEGLEVEAQSLVNEQLPTFVLVEENSRRMRDFFALSQKELPSTMQAKYTFIVNTNSPLITSLFKLGKKDPALAKEAIRLLFELSLLSQKEFEGEELPQFIERNNKLLESFINQIIII